LGNYKWQKRFFFVSGNALYYRNLTEESGPSQFKSSNLLSGLSGDKKVVFGSNTEVHTTLGNIHVMLDCIPSMMLRQVLSSPFDSTQFSIAGAQNDRDREFVFKAANAGFASFVATTRAFTCFSQCVSVERQDWIEALLRCSGEEQPASPVGKIDSVSNGSSSDAASNSSNTRLPVRRASLPSIETSFTPAQTSATVQPQPAFVANFSNSSSLEFPNRPAASAHAVAQAPSAAAAAGATVARPPGGRLELNAKKVQVQKAIGDSEGSCLLVSKFALPAGTTSAWFYDPISVGEGAALTAQLKNHARTLTCLSFSVSHSELLQPLLAAIKPLNLLTHINITSQVFTRGAMQLFATAIEDAMNLSHISLCSAHLSDEILSVLLQSLSMHRHVTFLKFCDNNLTAEGFASILKTIPRITGLELDANPISSKFNSALPALQQGFKNASALTTMSLLQTGISVNEVDQLIQSFMQLDSLEHLAMDVTPRDLFDVIIKKSSSSAQFRFPPLCFMESGWPQCFWYVQATFLTFLFQFFYILPRYLKHSNGYGHATTRNITVCFLGPPSSGKTSVINALFGSTTSPVTAVDTSSPTVGFRRYVVPFDNPSLQAQVNVSFTLLLKNQFVDDCVVQIFDFGSQGDNAACLNSLLTCRWGVHFLSHATFIAFAWSCLFSPLKGSCCDCVRRGVYHLLTRCRYSLYAIVWKRPDTTDPLSEQQLMPLISWVRATAAMNPAATFIVVATHSNTPRPGESLAAYKSAFESMLKEVNSRIKLELQRIQDSYNSELTELNRTIEKLKAQLVAQEIRKRKLGSP
jgi:hypothetical protein